MCLLVEAQSEVSLPELVDLNLALDGYPHGNASTGNDPVQV